MQKIDASVPLQTPANREQLQAMISAALVMLFRLHKAGDEYTGAGIEFPPLWLDQNGRRFPLWPMPAGFCQDYSGYGKTWLLENLMNRVQFAVFHVNNFNDCVQAGDLKQAAGYAAYGGRFAAVIWNMGNDLCRLAFLPPGAVAYSPLNVPGPDLC